MYLKGEVGGLGAGGEGDEPEEVVGVVLVQHGARRKAVDVRHLHVHEHQVVLVGEHHAARLQRGHRLVHPHDAQ